MDENILIDDEAGCPGGAHHCPLPAVFQSLHTFASISLI